MKVHPKRWFCGSDLEAQIEAFPEAHLNYNLSKTQNRNPCRSISKSRKPKANMQSIKDTNGYVVRITCIAKLLSSLEKVRI